MSVSQRADGRWIVKYKDASGKWKQRSEKDEATARAVDFELHQEQTEDRRLAVGELVLLYFKSHPDLHHKTRNNIWDFIAGREDANGQVIAGRGHFLFERIAEELTRRDLEMMREAMRATGAGNNTINKMQAYLRAVLAWGVDQQLTNLNPWRDYKRLPVRKKMMLTTMADFRAILVHCPDWLKWAFATAYALAMRPGKVELFSLTWSAFNWRFGFVQYAQGKTGSIKRVYPPSAYWAEAKVRYQEDLAAGIPWVCHRRGRKVLDYNTAWRTAVKAAGMSGRGIRPYDIRHIAASEMLAAGADLSAVAAQMGHSNTQTTATTYAHVTPGGQSRAAELMPPLYLVQDGAEKSNKKG